MNSLFKSDGLTIPSLYVKSAKSTYDIRAIFQQARYMSPCLLIFEDIDTVVTQSTRSYFFNEVDVSSTCILLTLQY
jgi:SpoVK/Ycf46/Vps4 family AAA+-type ATPase